jgi:hypothetical protein
VTALAAFFERLDIAALDGGAEPDVHALEDDARLIAAGERMTGTFERYAERAGVDLDVLLSEIHERIESLAGTTRRRMEAAGCEAGEEREIVTLGCAAALQFFLAGALWEQERHLPDLDDGPGWAT